MTPPNSIIYWNTADNRFEMPASAEDWGPAHITALSPDGRLAATPDKWHGKQIALLRDARTGVPIRTLDVEAGLRPFGDSRQGKETGG